jgi:hypothetical protein
MQLLLTILAGLLLAAGLFAQDSGPVCRVNLLRNTVDLPHERRDGTVLVGEERDTNAVSFNDCGLPCL